MKSLAARLSYANVVSTLALFLAVAGGTTAVALSGKSSVKSDDIAKNAVRSKHLKDGTVRGRDLAARAVDSQAILDGAVGGPDMVTGAVGSREILDGGVWAQDLGPEAVGSEALRDGGVGTAELAPGAVGSTAILDGSVGTSDLAPVPIAHVVGSGTVVPGLNQVTGVDFTTDSSTGAFDPYDMWSASNPDEVVVPIGGVYLATARVGWQNDDTDPPGGVLDQGMRLLQITASGGQNERVVGPSNRYGDERTRQQATLIAVLDAGEDISVDASQANEGNSPIEIAEASLKVVWLAPAP